MNGRAVAALSAERFGGEVGQHFIDVHVARRAGAGLKDVDQELVVKLSAQHFAAGGGNSDRLFVRQQTELRVGGGAGLFEFHDRVDQFQRELFARHVKIFNRPAGMYAVQRIVRYRQFAEGIFFFSHVHTFSRLRRRLTPKTPVSSV